MADVTINDLVGQAPTSTDVFPFSTTGGTPSTYKATLAQIKTALAIPAAQIQSDWTQTNTSALDYIKNKPSKGMQVFTSGSGSWNIPTGVTSIKVTVVGGGGGGGGSGAGGSGGSSTFGPVNGVTYTGGGGGGAQAGSNGLPGVPGVGTNGNLNVTGGRGAFHPVNALTPGMGGGSLMGFGGTASDAINVIFDATGYGGGGAGGSPNTGFGYQGGGGAGAAIAYVTIPTGTTSIAYSVGSGGAGGGASATNGSGGVVMIEW